MKHEYNLQGFIDVLVNSSSALEQDFIDTVIADNPFQKHEPCFQQSTLAVIDSHTSKGGLKHNNNCSRAFGRYDSTCERCRELMTGAKPRKGWKF